ncbi:uncharacterized protein PADG_12202 [Paracoccidioides brasiliensis Pb18]|uniref:Uncharacterized protein n=1 Tax=Paracoccidioides brasiliensis (strain Pb18) TaxID=502780 RepID=A0A0A0HSZ3_PARBD|nr:uncharacterized protein PADG_12202 [Paracoccidioides brasiliensis Pb18]KGM91742.1 hypothetical protein PADG_12202 [Paracoccidioides brasiliensis Pb18]
MRDAGSHTRRGAFKIEAAIYQRLMRETVRWFTSHFWIQACTQSCASMSSCQQRNSPKLIGGEAATAVPRLTTPSTSQSGEQLQRSACDEFWLENAGLESANYILSMASGVPVGARPHDDATLRYVLQLAPRGTDFKFFFTHLNAFI